MGLRASLLLLLGLAACPREKEQTPAPKPPVVAAAPAAPPTIGPWGETLALTPDFCLPQERRAPKVPDGAKLWKTLEAPLAVERIENALLLCHAQVTDQVQWDGFFGPDLLFELSLGHAPPVRLWGPEDHWRMYVSVPRVTLARGDVIGLRAWDRDVSSKTEIGFVVITFDGTFPIHLKYTKDAIDYLDVECRTMSEAQAIEGAKPRLRSLDLALDRIRAEPDPHAINWGIDTPAGITWVKGNYGGETFRYPAGFIGWEHPLMQERLARLKGLEEAWAHAKLEALAKLTASLPPVGGWTELTDGAALRVTKLACGPAPGACTIGLETRGLPNGLGELAVGVVDAAADFRPAPIAPGAAANQFILTALPEPRPRLVYLSRNGLTYLKVE